MLRFILILILLLVLYYVLHLLIKDMPSGRKRRSRSPEAEELVQDPYCQTYIPKRTALRKRIAGRDYYFCNQECLTNFLRRGRV